MHSTIKGVLFILLLGGGLFLTPPPWAEPEAAPRHHIVLIQPEVSLLNPLLRDQLQARHTQFTFHIIEASIKTEAAAFLKQLKQYQQEHGNELAQKPDEERLVLGEQSVSWREARLLMVAAYVLVPGWKYSPLQLTGPHNHSETENGQWFLHLESSLTLTMAVHKNGTEPMLLKEITHHWPLIQELRIGDIGRLAALVKEKTGQDIDPQNPEHRGAMLDFLKQLDKFKTLEQTPPDDLMQPLSEKQLHTMPGTPVLEALDDLKAPPLSQSIPGTSLGLYLGLRLGTGSLSMGIDNNFFNPQAELDIGYDIGRNFGFPSFYLTLGGGTGLPFQPIQAPSLSLLPLLGELGFVKQWDFGPWIIGVGLRGGLLFGFINDSFGRNLPLGAMATNMTFGGTGLVQLQYRWGANLKTGLDLGWRFYTDSAGPWTIGGGLFNQPAFFPPLGSYGPLLNAFVAWEF